MPRKSDDPLTAEQLQLYKILEEMGIRVVDIDLLEPHPLNPNAMQLEQFNELADGIGRDGFLEPILVVPLADTGQFGIVSGEHRWRAAKLKGMAHVPVVVKEGWTDEDVKIHLVRMNELRGRIDPEKFVTLWQGMKESFGEETLRKRMGFIGKDTELKRLLKQVEAQLPDHMKKELRKRADKIKSAEDIAAVVQSIFAKFGGTLDHHYVMFAWGGSTHLMVQSDEKTFKPIEQLAEWCSANGKRLDEALAVRALCQCAGCRLDDLPDALPKAEAAVAQEEPTT